MSNFDFLKDFDDTLYKLGKRIEEEVSIAPSAVKADATPFLEYLLNKLLNRMGRTYNYQKDFYTQVDTVYRNGLIDYNYKNKIYDAYMQRNKIHDTYEELVKNELIVAVDIHKKLFYIAKKYYRDFNENDDGYNEVPSFKPLEFDTTDEEIDMVEIPDFSEIVEFGYDRCVICGKPNHSSYSIFCPDCNSILDNANNFISIRNHFGKDATFTKENLIEYGLQEGYVNALISHLVRQRVLKVSGRFISFDNMNYKGYMALIDDYLAVGELITKFKEDKITPAEIKQTREYRDGGLQTEPFIELYRIVNEEIIKKFERDILTTEDIWKSMSYTTITQMQLEKWYLKNLGLYERGQPNESFETFNRLLMAEYIDLKRQGIAEKDIKAKLNVSPRVYDFWNEINDSFESELTKIKRDLILEALAEGKTKAEAIEIAGVTPNEFDNLYKLSRYHHDEYAVQIDREFEARRLRFISYLESMDLEVACRFAKITLDDFYKWYDSSKPNSEFYIDSSRILMGKFLDERRKGKTGDEALNIIGMKERHLNKWMKRNSQLKENFYNENLDVSIALVLRGFKWDRTKREISQMFGISVNEINRFLKSGEYGTERFRQLFDYYQENVIPKMLEMFLHNIRTKTLQKALDAAELSGEELEKYYQLGLEGDERYRDFYERYHEFKVDTYVNEIISSKSPGNALKKSNLSDEEFGQLKESLENRILHRRIDIVKREILNDSTTEKAAQKAGVTFDEVYGWYYKGKTDEEFGEFSEFFFSHYIEPNVLHINDLINKGRPIDKILAVFDINLTRRDFDIWQSDGLINAEDVVVNLDDEEDGDDDKEEFNLIRHDSYNSKLYDMLNKDGDGKGPKAKDVFFPKKKRSKSPSILTGNDYDAEELKRQILKK